MPKYVIFGKIKYNCKCEENAGFCAKLLIFCAIICAFREKRRGVIDLPEVLCYNQNRYRNISLTNWRTAARGLPNLRAMHRNEVQNGRKKTRTQATEKGL